MQVLGLFVVVTLLAGAAGLTAAQAADVANGNGQLGAPTNPKTPVFIVRPTPNGPFTVVPPGTLGSRETVPFSDEPHFLNNAHPMQPNAGLGYAVRQVWMPPRPVTMQVYVPSPEGIPSRYQTMYAQVKRARKRGRPQGLASQPRNRLQAERRGGACTSAAVVMRSVPRARLCGSSTGSRP